jgi:F-type H+-transporting ATPase subunit epsilon
MATFKLRVVTPSTNLLDKDIEFLTVRTTEGDLGILPNHAPFVAELAVGEMKVKADGIEEFYFLSDGFLEMSKDNVVTILADEALNVKDLDKELAKKNAIKAEEQLKKARENKELALAERNLKVALMKMSVSEKYM